LNETGLRPFEGRQVIAEVAVTNADPPFGAPMCYVG